VHQKECCRIALAGLARADGLSPSDAGAAIADLLATPVTLDTRDREALETAARRLAEATVA
jgi:hypothetical protein